MFATLKDGKQMYKKFKNQQLENKRELREAADLLSAWSALAESGPKTAQYINE